MIHPVASPNPADQSIGYMLRRAQANARIAFDAALLDYEITAPQFAILNELHLNPGQSSADLSRRSTLTAQAVNLTVRHLEQRKLLERSPHPVHGRILQTALTPAGRVLRKQCLRRIRAVEAQMLRGLTDKEQRIISAWLVRTAHAPDLNGSPGSRIGGTRKPTARKAE